MWTTEVRARSRPLCSLALLLLRLHSRGEPRLRLDLWLDFWLDGRRRWGRGTTSVGIVFLPFFVGIVALFYNAKKGWAWDVTRIGLAILIIEILSRLRFLMNMKTSHLMIMLVTFAASAGLMLRSYRDESLATEKSEQEGPKPN